MIEIEKNFDLRPGDKERLIYDAELIESKSFTDTYYDNATYNLTSKDFWLRKRNNRFELKAPLNTKGVNREITDQYRELETDIEIATELGLLIKTDLITAITEAGYEPFAVITTKREHYRKGDFNLDFDEVSDLDYTTLEVELIISTIESIPAAEARILDFAKEYGITTPGRGKLIEYLLKNNPDHYRVLKVSGVIRD